MMNIFSRKKTESTDADKPLVSATISSSPDSDLPIVSTNQNTNQGQLAEIALNNIHDGVIVTNGAGVIQFINPAAAVMTDAKTPDNAVGLDYALVLKIADKDGQDFAEEENPLLRATTQNQTLENFSCTLISGTSGKKIPIAVTVLPVSPDNKIITFRDITKELAEEGEQADFISTASHEMRTPVATIDGYITLALNPQTATIDDRARGYLDSASKAAKHLGKLFQDLLDVTKLDDGRIRPELVPVEMITLVKQIATDHAMKAKEANLSLYFGANTNATAAPDDHRVEQMIYSFVDINFLREVLDNLIDNAIKYTPANGSIYVNVVGEDDEVVINVTDTGIGISSEDLQHIFQKFYRADNSDTREIGGTGLGLYIAKQRVEAMGGRIWAESVFGNGTTFYVALPRISAEEYQKRMIIVQNNFNPEGGK